MVICSGFKRLELILQASLSRQYKNWSRRELWIAAQGARDFIAIYIRHHHIGNDEIGLEAMGESYAALAVIRRMHGAVKRLQCMSNQLMISGSSSIMRIRAIWFLLTINDPTSTLQAAVFLHRVVQRGLVHRSDLH